MINSKTWKLPRRRLWVFTLHSAQSIMHLWWPVNTNTKNTFSTQAFIFRIHFHYILTFCLVPAGGGYGDGNIQKCQSHPGKIWSWSKEKTCECSFLLLKFKASLYFLELFCFKCNWCSAVGAWGNTSAPSDDSKTRTRYGTSVCI